VLSPAASGVQQWLGPRRLKSPATERVAVYIAEKDLIAADGVLCFFDRAGARITRAFGGHGNVRPFRA
jgi:hypothetical protein